VIKFPEQIKLKGNFNRDYEKESGDPPSKRLILLSLER